MNKVRELHPQNQNPVFHDQLVTLADLQVFKNEIMLGIQQLLTENKQQSSKKWLKPYQVKKILWGSSGTLQTLRSNRTLPYTKIGGIIYYDTNDIDKLLSVKSGHFYSGKITAKNFKNHA
jgi:hypothetical protein